MLKQSLVFGLFLVACSNDTLRSRPLEPVATGDVDEPVIEEPVPAEPCMFYGVDEAGTLWAIDPEGPSATAVGETGVPRLTDLAIDPDGVIWAVDKTSLYVISADTGVATLFAADIFLDWEEPVAAGSLPGDKLLLGASGAFKVLDLQTDSLSTRGSLSGSATFSGDFAVIDATSAYATVRAGEVDDLYWLDLAEGTTRRLGGMGYRKVWGLDYGCDDRLYAMVSADPPRLLAVDATETTMSVEDLGTFLGPTSLWGAAGPGRF